VSNLAGSPPEAVRDDHASNQPPPVACLVGWAVGSNILFHLMGPNPNFSGGQHPGAV